MLLHFIALFIHIMPAKRTLALELIKLQKVDKMFGVGYTILDVNQTLIANIKQPFKARIAIADINVFYSAYSALCISKLFLDYSDNILHQCMKIVGLHFPEVILNKILLFVDRKERKMPYVASKRM